MSYLRHDKQFITKRELSQKLGGINASTIYRLMKTGDLPTGVKIGHRRLWDVAEVEQFIEAKNTKK